MMVFNEYTYAISIAARTADCALLYLCINSYDCFNEATDAINTIVEYCCIYN